MSCRATGGSRDIYRYIKSRHPTQRMYQPIHSERGSEVLDVSSSISLTARNLRAVQGTAAGRIASRLFKTNNAGFAHILIFRFHSTDYVTQPHPMHPGVISINTQVRSSSSQTASRPHAAPRGATKTHPGALIVFSDHHKATCCT